MPDALRDAPELPFLGSHVWEWFLEIAEGRIHDINGAKRISQADISDWAAGTGMTILGWERRAIRKIDAAVLEVTRVKND